MKNERKLGLKQIASLILVAVLISSVATYVFASSPSSTIYISGGAYPGAPDYTIYSVAGTYYAKNQNGYTEFSGTDAATVIQDAIDASNGTVYLQTGEYSISDTIQLKTDVTLKGSGFGTHLILADGVNKPLINAANGVIRWHIEDLWLDGNKAGQTSASYGVTIYNDDSYDQNAGLFHVYIRNVKGDGILSYMNRRIYVSHCFIYYCTGNGIHFTGGEHLDVFNSYIAQNDGHGLQSDAIQHCKIIANTFSGNHLDNFYGTLTKSYFEQNMVAGADGYGMHITDHFATVVGNEFWENQNGSIYITDSAGGDVARNNMLITNNQMIEDENNGGTAVLEARNLGENCIISNNLIEAWSNFTYGIKITYCTLNVTITNNAIKGMSGAAISAPSNADVFRNAGWRTENSGSATNSTATTFSITHGLAGTPTGVWCSFDTTTISGWGWTATSSTITVTVAGTGLPSSITCYWKAEYKP